MATIYTYDCEFNEDGKTIDLLSIAIVRDDGKYLYLLNKEFQVHLAWNNNSWLINNVFLNIWKEWNINDLEFNVNNFKGELDKRGLTKAQIKEEIISFIQEENVELWGYYSDYDHVVLSQIFGKMIDLPSNFPMFTMDLKQELIRLNKDGQQNSISNSNEHSALSDALWIMECVQQFIKKSNN